MSTEARIVALDARLAAMQQRIEVLHSALVTAVDALEQQARRAAEYLQAVSFRYDKRIDELQQLVTVDDLRHATELGEVRHRLFVAENRLTEIEAERGAETVH